MTIPWSELTDSLSDILIEDAIDHASDKGVKVSRAALEQAAKARAAELVDREMFPTTRKNIQQLTVSGIEGATGARLREAILKSPAWLLCARLDAGPHRAGWEAARML